ncbi:MAG TPA: hypothetical protein VKL21_12090 [Candidatus Methanoperedens sp.]|nr:hypothetical protein [Candidatus Methanoperedens sp.]
MGYSYASCHQRQSILEVVAALRIGTAKTEVLTHSGFKIYSNGRFHARLETDTGDWLDTTVKKHCPW